MQTNLKLCRLCGAEGEHNIEIFSSNHNQTSLAQHLKQFCNFKLKKSNILPTKICSNCNLRILECKSFIEICIETQEKLSLIINQNNIKLEPTEESIDSLISDDNKFSFENEECGSDDTEEENTPLFLLLNKQKTVKEDENSIEQDQFKLEAIELVKAEHGDEGELKEEEQVKIPFKYLKGKRMKSLFDGFQCNVCGRVFSNTNGLNHHKKIKHPYTLEDKISKNFPCTKCEEIFFTEDDIIHHMKTKHSIVEESCPLPYIRKEVKFKLKNCPHCERTFRSASGRWSHIITVHERGSQSIICDECGKEFISKGHLQKHKYVHNTERNFLCPECPARFKSKRGMNAHKETHGDKYPCSLCGTVLNTKFLLKNHMIVHEDKKEYKCNFCPKEFKRKKGLNSHINNIHKRFEIS